MQNKPVMGMTSRQFWHCLFQPLFHHQRRFPRGHTGSVADPKQVCVHSHGRLAEGGVEHHISGFAADPGQRLQFFAVLWHLARMVHNQGFA